MKAALLGLVVVLSDCQKVHDIKAVIFDNARVEAKSGTQSEKLKVKLPSATEVFQLQSKCAQLAKSLDKSLPYGAYWRRDIQSNYNFTAALFARSHGREAQSAGRAACRHSTSASY